MGRTGGPRRRPFRRLAAIGGVVAALLLTSCTNAVDPAARFGGVDTALPDAVAVSLQAVLADAVARSGSSGGLAAVSAPWAGEWSAATGAVGFDDGDAKVTEETEFRLGPATGEVTCLLLLRLVDLEVVALDDQVSTYVRDIPGLDGITLEQLCRQTSGLADYYPALRGYFAGNPVRVWPPGELIAGSLAASRVGAPGQTWSPSTSGVLLLALALERAAHRDWSDLADEYVLNPLGIDGVDLPDPADPQHPGTLDAYLQGALPDGSPDCAVRIDVSAQSSSIGGEAAGATSTLDDAVRLSEAFATGALLTEPTAEAQWVASRTSPDAPGWQAQGIGGRIYGPLRGTAGETLGALTAAFTDPESGLTVVVALNNSTAGAEFAQQVAFALASVAARAPAAAGQEQPTLELPWSLEQATQRMAELGRCPLALPTAEPPAADAPA
ncbi:serine hydrolase domain-containing protein [Agromyces sp. MMS24-JH15]|uniref:serine hydrolase domain-containing protein n=1 Tax=Agromyces sp. MMS24-JH15 TaxID=3243765 RepID=UPI003749E1F6